MNATRSIRLILTVHTSEDYRSGKSIAQEMRLVNSFVLPSRKNKTVDVVKRKHPNNARRYKACQKTSERGRNKLSELKIILTIFVRYKIAKQFFHTSYLKYIKNK